MSVSSGEKPSSEPRLAHPRAAGTRHTSHRPPGPHALPDLFLQAAGRGGDKLTARAGQQQHRHRIGVQDLLDPRQQLSEKVISAQIPQCRIGNRPDIPELVLCTCQRVQWRHHQERPRHRDRAACQQEPLLRQRASPCDWSWSPTLMREAARISLCRVLAQTPAEGLAGRHGRLSEQPGQVMAKR